MKTRITKLAVMLLAVGLTFTACKKDETNNPPVDPAPKTIAQVASDNPDFSILVDALTRTGLVAAVNDPNANLTVFAPTNAAFSALLNELQLPDLDAVETALGTEGLKTVLLYHVIGSRVPSSAVTTGYANTLATNSGNQPYSVYLSTASGVRLNNRATVTTANVEASNGVIHVIDRVILPLSVFQLLSVNPDFSSLTTALSVADGNLDELLDNPASGPFTLFAPTNAAFADALNELQIPDLTTLVNTLGTSGVADVLTYHVLSGNITSAGVPAGSVTTANGGSINISLGGGVAITDANGRTSNVIAVDIQGVNGVIHIINKVLLP